LCSARTGNECQNQTLSWSVINQGDAVPVAVARLAPQLSATAQNAESPQ